uniref:Bm8562 n=1 Tax=Brugia malayi TaxID=6279 RepID=A0A1I9G009_BRUMA|nr:Bm8562 [Brugia malayi]
MRSQKQVRRVGKVRSLKNAAAGKWKIYRKCLEARKACNTLVPPKPTRRRMKEPKQRSAEELAERQRLREQRHLEKKLAKQRASTSTLPETRKKKVKFTLYTLFWKKLEEGFGNGSPKKASAGHKTTTKTTKIKNSMMKDTTKAKRLMNEQVQRAVNMVEQEIAAIKLNKLKAMKVPKLRTESIPKRQYLMSTQEQEINQSSSPTKLEQKELVQSKKVVFNRLRTEKFVT